MAYDWDRNRVRPAVGGGVPFLLFRLQDGFTVPPWLTIPELPVASPFRLRVSQHLDHAAFPVPATSNAACGFPTLRSPVCFAPSFMGPIMLGRLSAWRAEPGS